MPGLVLLDLDGTVLDGGGLPAAMRATCEVAARGLQGATADDLVRANAAAWQRMWPAVENDYMLGGRAGTAIELDVWRAALADCGLVDPGLLALTLAEWQRQERGSFRLFDDVLPTLAALANAGVRVGMVTNGSSSVQRAKLEAVGLAARFDPLVISAEVGVVKPDPAIFEVALARAGVGAAGTWFVGDNVWHDIPGAAELGITTVWLDRKGVGLQHGAPEPTSIARSLAELRFDA